MALISSDVFKSIDYANELQKKFYDVEDQGTLAIGTFGAEAELFGRTFQNSVRIASELSNESIPNKAKYPKNIIAHASYLGITLDAVPAYMPVQIIIPKDQIDAKMENDQFVWDKDIKINIEDLEFHTDYDIIIKRNKIGTNKFVYTAIYDMSTKNPISDITKPYLPPVGIITITAGPMLIISCTIRQVEHKTVNHRVLSDNDIENKTYVFTFEDQLAGFDILSTEGDKQFYITPVYDGSINNVTGYTCEYQYIDTNTVMLKFNRDSYLPKINANIDINLKLTKGAAGNFSTTEEVLVDVSSDKYNYKGLYASVKPSGDSDEGRDKKTTEEIRKEIPKEGMSRGIISTTTDLANFFNNFNTEESKLYPYKKKYNGIDHIYYAYLVMKKFGNIVPANTIDIKVDTSQLIDNETQYILKPLSNFVYDGQFGRIVSDEEVAKLDDLTTFVYTNPYMMVINKNPIIISYYLNIIDVNKYVMYDYINQSVQLQMIMSSLNIQRSGVIDRNKYHINFQMTQNINTDYGMIQYDDEGNIDDSNLKVFIVFYSEKDATTPYRYAQCTLNQYFDDDFVYSYGLEMETDDTILVENKIKISNLLQPESGLKVDSYLENGCAATIYILAKLDRKYGEDPITNYIPGLEGYSLCNKYKIDGGIDLFYNYTQFMNSTPILTGSKNGVHDFEIRSVPMIRKSYMNSETRIIAVISELENRRTYLEYCLNIIEDGFEVDLKFVNTYGPSKRFMLKDGSNINRVNMSLEFEAKLYSESDKYILDLIIDDIKSSIEDINEINELHFANLVTEIKNKYSDQLYYFEFLGFNNYGPGQQYIKGTTEELMNDTPEFLNINTATDGTPDIFINRSKMSTAGPNVTTI